MKHKKLITRAIAIQKKIDAIKDLYNELDDITEQLQKVKFKSYTDAKNNVYLVDNFANQNHAFRTTSIRRFELRIEKKKK